MSRKSTHAKVRGGEWLEQRVVFNVEYFVDPIGGNDNNNGLTPSTALRSVERLVSQYDALKPKGHIELSAGDSITLMPGEHQFAYRYGEGQWQGLFLRNVHGTAKDPITIRGMDGAKINNRAPDGSEMSSINILQSSHIVVENLDVTSYGSAILVADANNIFLRDNYIHDVDGLAYNNLSGVYLTGVRNAEITNNLFTDNYDRSRPGNANNRHIVIFGSSDIKVIGNTMRNANPNLGMAVDFKHLGGLPADEVGYYEVAYNTIINAAGTAIGTAAPNSYIHHNLLLDSGSIRVADLGGTTQLANERIEYNTIVNSVDYGSGGGLSYFPTEYAGYPLGKLNWSHNLVVDNRLYAHPENSTLMVDHYGSDLFYQRVFANGLFQADGNVYQTRDAARFDLYAASGRYGDMGTYLNFQQWQQAGFDRSGRTSTIRVDDYLRDKSNLSSQAGIYGGTGRRLTSFVSQLDIDETGTNSTSRLRIVRSGSNNSEPLSVSIGTSQSGELRLPSSVVIPAGVDAIELDIQGLGDNRVDSSEAIQITVSASDYLDATTWLRLHDSAPIADPIEQRSGVFQVPGIAGEAVRLQSTVTKRWAEYDNEMGIAYVDDAQGRVGNLLPSDPGWAQALVSRQQNMQVLPSGVTTGDMGQVDLVAGRFFVFYLVQDSSLVDWQAKNPSNRLDTSPILFTSIESGNPDLYDHVREVVNGDIQNQSIDLAWEDLNFGGDQSFTDLVVENKFLPTDGSGGTCRAIDDAFQTFSSDDFEMNVLANDQVTADARIASFTQPEFGKVSVSPSNTKLVYEPEPYQFGLVHFSYTVGSGQQKSSADVELAIGKSWTNVETPGDVNGDGTITPLDVLVVINALRAHGQIALPDYPKGPVAYLNSIDVDGDKQLTVNDALLVIVDLLVG